MKAGNQTSLVLSVFELLFTILIFSMSVY